MADIFEQILDGENKESDVAYAAFCLYRDAGLQRSFIRVAESVKKSYTLIRRWAKRHDWEARAKAYDRWVEGVEFEARRKEILTTRQKHINLARSVQVIVGQALVDAQENIKKKKKVRLTPMEMARLLELSTKLESTAMGIPSEVSEQQTAPTREGLGYIDMVMNTRQDSNGVGSDTANNGDN